MKILEDIDCYFNILSKEDADQFITDLYARNSNRQRSVFIKAMFEALHRGISKDLVYCAEVDTNGFRIILKRLASMALTPFRRITAVNNVLNILHEEESVMNVGGFYNPRKNKFCIIINKNFDSFNKNLDDFTLYILLHEMCHFFAANNVDDYNRLFQADLVKYYSYLLRYLALVTNDAYNFDDEKEKTIATILVSNMNELMSKKSLEHGNYYMKNIKDMLQKMFKIDNYLTVCWWSVCQYVLKNMGNIDSKLSKILSNTYQRAFGISNLDTLFELYQELYSTSEVIAIRAYQDYKKPEYISMLQMIFK